MKQVIITAQSFSLITLAIILFASISESQRKITRDRVFALFSGVGMIPLAFDLFSWILDGRTEWVWALEISITMSIVPSYAVSLLFMKYLYEHIRIYTKIHRIAIMIPVLYTIIMMIVSLLLCISGQMYVLDEAVYSEGPAYPFYMMTTVIMYLYSFVIAAIHFKKMPTHDKIAFLSYSFMPSLAIGINVLYPELSLSYPAFVISVLIIYSMLQTEHQRAAMLRERDLIERNNTDELTGIRNRRAYIEDSKKLDGREKVGILFCDLNGLKYINDVYGHEQGDERICELAAMLVNVFGNQYTYRISGDEFLVIRRGAPDYVFQEECEKFHSLNSEPKLELASMGSAWGSASQMKSLVQQAQEKMYIRKAVFHRRFPQLIRSGNLFKRDTAEDTVEQTQNEESEKQTGKTRTGSIGKTMLIVQHRESEKSLLNELLAENYAILTMEAEEAVAYLKQEKDNVSMVVLADEQQVTSSVEFLRAQQTDPDIMQIPVVVITSLNEREAEERYIRLGAYDCIHRPVSPSLLLSRIQRTIEMRENAALLSTVEFDELTGLYTRGVFFHRVQNLLEQSREQYDMIILDVQGFRHMNQHFSGDIGNSVLRHIGNYLRTMQSGENLFGYFGIDQFCGLMKRQTGDAQPWIKMIKELQATCPIEGITIKCGIYSNVDHSIAPAELCDYAIAAVQSIKHSFGVPAAIYDADIRALTDRERNLERDMATARAAGQFKIFYQPKHNAHTGEIVGAEALFRWEHPEFGSLSPSEFIPLFERSGFIGEADYYAWQTTCVNIRKWQERGVPVVPVSVNNSRQDFSNRNWLESLHKEASEAGVSPDLLHIEVTESLFSNKIGELTEALERFRQEGYKVELDDFGSGYSSLNTLGSLPIDIAKLDRVFLKSIDNVKGKQVLSSCIQMIKRLGISALCEGVESKQQLELLVSLGCDSVQGFYFSKPLPEEEFANYLLNYKPKN